MNINNNAYSVLRFAISRAEDESNVVVDGELTQIYDFLNNIQKKCDESGEMSVNGFDLCKFYSSRTQQELKDECAVVGIIINGKFLDLSTKIDFYLLSNSTNEGNEEFDKSIDRNCIQAQLISANTSFGREILRHSTAHIMAKAAKNLYPDVQITIGPVIENGFYYDFYCGDRRFNEDDLVAISAEMYKIIKSDARFRREEVSREYAIDYFRSIGESYKALIVESIPYGEVVSIYWLGDDFCDLCRGTHIPSSRYAKNFRLTKCSGSYWRGDSKNEQLQRVYGTAWESADALDKYVNFLEEVKKRDHRAIGTKMNLFHIDEENPGMVFWHDHGWRIFNTLVSYMRNKQNEIGYQEINTPQVLSRSLWEKSGHWDKYSHHMYVASVENSEELWGIKPMSCPGAVSVFSDSQRSYRELPIRLSEFGKVHRYEPSGALHGLFRVRAFTQDDAHIFCTDDQLISEIQVICGYLISVYKDFGFENTEIKVSTRPKYRIGTDEIWDASEGALMKALTEMNHKYTISPGDGAFYGPKIEFKLRDAIGREWQMGTVQVDFNLPERLSAQYVDNKGEKRYPIMIHQAVFGSLERFIGILLENTKGILPMWLAPVHFVILPLNNEAKVMDYIKRIEEKIQEFEKSRKCKKFMYLVDDSNETLNYRMRKHIIGNIQYYLVIGGKEIESNVVSVRNRDNSINEELAIDDFLDKISNEITTMQ